MTIKTEHGGAKNGGGLWGSRNEAKSRQVKRLRREAGKAEIANPDGDTRHLHKRARKGLFVVWEWAGYGRLRYVIRGACAKTPYASDSKIVAGPDTYDAMKARRKELERLSQNKVGERNREMA